MPIPSAEFDTIAGRHLIRSEIWRASLLIGAAAVVIGMAALMMKLMPSIHQENLVHSSHAMASFVLLAIYEVIVLVLLWRRKNQVTPAWFRYVNTAIELIVPTVTILILGTSMGLAQALNGAAPWVYFVIIVLTALYLDFRLCIAAGLLAAAQFALLSMLAVRNLPVVPGWEVLTFQGAYWFKAACLLLTGLATGFVASQIRRQLNTAIHSMAERSRAISIFGQHVSPQVAEMLLNQPHDSAGEERSVCVMFLDIRDFSVYAADHSPAEVVEYLNALFGELILEVNRHDGIINKFLGDGFMAVFGAPVSDGRQCEHAVAASKDILAIVRRLNREGRIPQTRLGIGLHLGEAITGNVGSSERKEYTIIGDCVNLAARIEQATKMFHAEILISEQVFAYIDVQKDPVKDLGMVELKGQNKPTHLYQLLIEETSTAPAN